LPQLVSVGRLPRLDAPRALDHLNPKVVC
jgi:hypothetical protein